MVALVVVEFVEIWTQRPWE